jgi:hypothetical protein
MDFSRILDLQHGLDFYPVFFILYDKNITMKFKGTFIDRTAVWGLIACVLFILIVVIASLHD